MVLETATEMPRDVDELSIDEIRQRYVENGEPVSARMLSRLQRDPRQGVRQLYAALKKRFERERDERLRLSAMRHFELLLWKSGRVATSRAWTKWAWVRSPDRWSPQR